MSTPETTAGAGAQPASVSDVRNFVFLAIAVVLAFATLYALFFAPQTVLHELAHDGRHLFGAPCH
ncbi:CbtB domain-containing protein [Actinocorallia sp. A-T 12471]|uniref:CbtB domain-containing protein n=1 Tax=Actinocorallia sp. A-T 12471 TaxID=3089813 RepID=UPI0029CAE3DF|nr:CbtB domain-containing protein [Actinocorallia sp. A-T 12471]MDX6739024.1 CbtB domain-containing protein [Actinocorallia sp. A-T 12471]